MDKLQPIIKHRFWILFGLTLPIALYAYYSANGSLKTAAQEREAAITSTLNGISSGQEPNPTFAEGLKKINEVQDARVKAEIRRLWERQKSRMIWPDAIAGKVPPEYRGEFDLQVGVQYKSLYPKLIQQVYEYAEPVPMDGSEVSWKPKVIMGPTVIPRHSFNKLNVESEEIWDAQEDIWFLRVLLEAVRDMNADADTVVNAVIRRIDRLELLGGTGESSVVASASSTGGGGGYEEAMMAGGMGGESSGYGEFGDGMSGGGGFGAAKGKVAFDPAEELGSQVDPNAAPSTGGDSAYTGGGEMPMGGGIATQQNLLRYVAFDESAPFQERGFYMSIIIDETKIPEFLVRLSNSEWPIRLLRFHMGPNPYATAAGRRLVDSGAMGGLDGFSEYGGEYAASAGPMPGGSGYTGGLGGTSPGAMPQFKGKHAALAGALSHPNLVQVDLCGVITMYKPPAEDVLASADAGGDQAAETTGEPAGTDAAAPTTGEEPAGDGTTNEAAAGEAATEETSAGDGNAGTTEPAATDQTAPETPAEPVDAAPSSAAGEPETDGAAETTSGE